MSEKEKYTAEDIRLYLEGKLTPSQMHALEREVLNDPFLADALEGMDLFKDKEQFFSDADELRSRLNERVKSKKAVVLPISQLWWKIAAVLVIIVTGVAVIIYTGEKNKPATELARTETKRDTAVPDQKAEAVTTVPVAPVSQDTNEQAFVKKPSPVKKAIAPKSDGNDTEVKNYSVVPEKQTDSSVLFESVQQQAAAKTDNDTPQIVSRGLHGRDAGVIVANSKARQKAAATEIFDESGNALEVVVVKLRKSKKPMQNRESTILSESEKRRVVPERGWDQFEQYLEDSTRLTKEDSAFTGEEALTFTIDDSGSPKEIKILRSISPEHDKEAIRLLEEGPSWKILKGKKRNITLRIIF